MGQVSRKLRKTTDGYTHWCNGCQEMHILPNTWKFVNNDVLKPTFTPSFKHSGVQRVFENGAWTGEWKYDHNGDVIPYVCHYVLTDGILHYCVDCTHNLVGQAVELPDLPAYYTNYDIE